MRYDREDELYDVVLETTVKKGHSAYPLSSVQRISKDASTIRFDRLKIEKV